MQAYIGEIIPVSTKKIKDKLCQVISFSGCDFKCPYCNTPELTDFKEEFLIDIREIKKEMKNNASFIEGVYITGGEPCLQRLALIEVCKYAKELNLKVFLDTNASKPNVIRELIDKKLVDHIDIDIKAPFVEKTFEKVTRSSTFFITSKSIIDDIKESVKIIRESNIDIEISTTIVPSLIFRKEDILSIAHEVKELNSIWKLKQFDNSEVKNSIYSGVEPASEKFMISLKEMVLSELPNMRIEIILNEEESDD